MGRKKSLTSQKVCFTCLRQFEISEKDKSKDDRCQQKRPKSRKRKLGQTVPTNSEENQNEVFKKFVSFIRRYLGVTSEQSSILNLEERNGKKTKNLKDVKYSPFCDTCVEVIGNICDLYHELCAVQLRLSSRLGDLGELINYSKRKGMPDKQRKTNLKHLAEQLCTKEFSIVDELRCVIASKCESKGLGVCPGLCLNRILPSSSQPATEDIARNDVGTFVKMETDEAPLDDDRLNDWLHQDSDNNGLAKPALSADESFLFLSNGKDGSTKQEYIITESVGQRDIPCQATAEKTERDEKDDIKESGSEYCPSESGSDSEIGENEDVSTKPRKKREKRIKLEAITAKKPPRKRKYEPGADSDTPVCCNLCGAMFNTTSLLASHLNQKHETEKGDIKCCFCWMSFTFEQTYNAHLRLKHKRANETMEELFKCDSTECGLSFGDLTGLNEHLMVHTDSDKIHHCSVCNHGFISKSFMNYHELVHTRPVRGLITCPQCQKVVHGLQNFMDHFNFKHGEKLELYKCPKCDQKLSSERVLNWHLKWHKKKEESDPEAEVNVVICKSCGKKCKDKEELEAHNKIQHPPKICSECGAQFKNKELLRRHMTSEHTTRKYTCSICGEVFHFIKRYDKHMQNVHNVTGFQCSICNKTFTFRHSLTHHMKILHADNKETHLCQQCGDTFTSSSYLTEHIARKHFSEEQAENDGRHACPYCEKRFIRIFHVQKHMAKCEKNPHPGSEATGVGSQLLTQSIICDQCGKAFTSTGMLRVHARRVHS
ncbi:unnamed protein product [Orchesella dallaii]|uniref:C2H2-type domain-containing protein n=1 Tax=Orchesella dallaii TaxID=48710 RepID=A0ABP1R354_9HEXA